MQSSGEKRAVRARPRGVRWIGEFNRPYQRWRKNETETVQGSLGGKVTFADHLLALRPLGFLV